MEKRRSRIVNVENIWLWVFQREVDLATADELLHALLLPENLHLLSYNSGEYNGYLKLWFYFLKL